MYRSVIAAASAALLFGASAIAQDDAAQNGAIDFGDDASAWARDGECDDPRFEGRGMTGNPLQDADRGHDAADCRTAFERGRITLREDAAGSDLSADLSTEPSDAPEAVDAPDAGAPVLADVDYGDDSSEWADDGECDDPRFVGAGVAGAPTRDNAGRDAADCAAAVADGTAVYAGELEALWDGGVHDGVDFGDNSGRFAGDAECDDPRFAGDRVALSPSRLEAFRDAHDCRQAYDSNAARYVGELTPAFAGEYDGVDFGDNEGGFPFDEECDDPRFEGDNVAQGAGRTNVRHDADDCRAAYDLGQARYVGELPPLFEGAENGVEYGDNSGPYVEDGECDDPRFSGADVAGRPQRAHIRQDAHDCHEAVVEGTAAYDGELEPLFQGVFEGVDFGDNEGPYPDDRECDDRRFRGPGMAPTPWHEDSDGHDAGDCQWHYARGFVRFAAADGLFEGRADGIDFGDNSGLYVNDGECDDRRFEGPGVSFSADGSQDRKDAFDCWVSFQDGAIALRE